MSRSGPVLAVFDMVGTTIAATDDVTMALQGAFVTEGLDLPAESMAGIRGRRKREAIVELLREVDPASPDPTARAARIERDLRQRLRAHYTKRPVRPIPGAIEAMQWLTARGVQVALATGLNRDLVRLLLDQLGWKSALFSAVVCGDEVARGRPAPDLIRRSMELSSVEAPGLVAAIGDTNADLDAAANAGVGCAIGVLSGAGHWESIEKLPHAVILDSVADLPKWWEATYECAVRT
jgi:phosphonatase-like hydrolase